MSVNPLESVTPPQLNPQPSTVPQAEQPPIFAKYQGDWKKANDGYFEAVKTLTQTQERAAAEAQRAQQLEGVIQALLGGTNPNADPLMALQNVGVPAEPFAAAVDSRLEARLGSLFGPLVKQMEADEQLSAEIDNYEQHRNSARKFMRENSEVAETFNALRNVNPLAAWKYAIRETLISQNAAPQNPAPTHAGLPSGQSIIGRGPDGAAPQQATREQEALSYGRAYGNMEAYRHERFRGTSVERAVRAALAHAGVQAPEGDY